MTTRRRLLAALIAVALSLPGLVFVLGLRGSALEIGASLQALDIGDSYVYNATTGTPPPADLNYGACSAVRFSAGSYRTLLKFNTGGVPLNATVTTVDLVNLVVKPIPATQTGVIQVHPEPTSWTEGSGGCGGVTDTSGSTVTWNHQPSSDPTIYNLNDVTGGPIPASGGVVDVMLKPNSITPGRGETDFWLSYSAGNSVVSIDSNQSCSTSPCATAPYLNVAYTVPTPTPTPTPTPPPGNPYCGTGGSAPTSKVMVIVEENHDYSSITSAAAPVLRKFASDCREYTSYSSTTHNSQPNYLQLASPFSYNKTTYSDCDPTATCSTSNDNIFAQVGPGNWKVYNESMSATCKQTSDAGNTGDFYKAKHNPPVYFKSIDGGTLNGTNCNAGDVPVATTTNTATCKPCGGNLRTDLSSTGTLPKLTMVIPNICNDMHDCSIATGESWLTGWLGDPNASTPTLSDITQSKDFTTGALTVIIVFDEDTTSSSEDVPGHVYAVAMNAKYTAGSTVAQTFTHQNLEVAISNLLAGIPSSL